MKPPSPAHHRPCSPHHFYHLDDTPITGLACAGLACFAARADAPERWQQAAGSSPPVFCIGQCHSGPALSGEYTRPQIGVHSRETVLLRHVMSGGVRDIASYQGQGGGQALSAALALGKGEILGRIGDSGLRGRGGAGFPTGRKWQAVASAIADGKYVIANADEGDPGAFSDRLLMEDDPFLLIEAMIIAGITVGAEQGLIYLRKEYPVAAVVLQDALQQARQAHWLGEHVLGSRHRFDLELVIGAGSYVCGEETAMLNAIEGRRPEIRVRPPQTSSHGLFGKPTLVNNVETLCAIPWIIRHGADAYAALGTRQSRGTKLLSLNSLFCRPGLYEVELGISLRTIVEEIGGGLRRGQLKGLMVGGPLAALIPPHCLDTPLDHESMREIGAEVGHGGVIAFADDSSLAGIATEVFRFGALESCGKCTPCHLGSPEVSRLFQSAARGQKIDGQRLRDLVDALAATSLCGHGRGLADFARSLQRHYPEEMAACFR